MPCTRFVWPRNDLIWLLKVTGEKLKLLEAESKKPSEWLAKLPTREEQVEIMSKYPEYDVLIIGGGCTGAGVAVDAVSRG
jgi:hypothetical protein